MYINPLYITQTVDPPRCTLIKKVDPLLCTFCFSNFQICCQDGRRHKDIEIYIYIYIYMYIYIHIYIYVYIYIDMYVYMYVYIYIYIYIYICLYPRWLREGRQSHPLLSSLHLRALLLLDRSHGCIDCE